eukprot:354287-Chlamydomonas_euryale.AAC.5
MSSEHPHERGGGGAGPGGSAFKAPAEPGHGRTSPGISASQLLRVTGRGAVAGVRAWMEVLLLMCCALPKRAIHVLRAASATSMAIAEWGDPACNPSLPM